MTSHQTAGVTIISGDPGAPQVANLLAEHLADLRRISPPGSVHALDIQQLRAPTVTFWGAWLGDDLLGCGALQALSATAGEIKSMRTASAHRGRGVGWLLLNHILNEARKRGYVRLNLETGSQPEFEPARRLYARAGFAPCGPFANYREDPNSVFLTLLL